MGDHLGTPGTISTADETNNRWHYNKRAKQKKKNKKKKTKNLLSNLFSTENARKDIIQ